MLNASFLVTSPRFSQRAVDHTSTAGNTLAAKDFAPPLTDTVHFGSSQDDPPGICNKKFLKAFWRIVDVALLAFVGYSYLNREKLPLQSYAPSSWPDNQVVVASSSQRWESQADRFTNPPQAYFTREILKGLADPTQPTLQEVINRLTGQGYKVVWPTHIYPVQSPRRLQGFDPRDRSTPRFLLVISGQDPQDAWKQRGFQADAESVRQTLGKYLNIPSSHILETKAQGAELTLKALKELSDRVNTLPENQPTEVIIYYIGHGSLSENGGKQEGDATGQLLVGKSNASDSEVLPEGYLKRLATYFPQSAKVLWLLDSCYSGAFISQEPQRVPDLFLEQEGRPG